VHRVANESGRPWTWWDYVMDYKIRCSMKEKKYSKTCAEDVVTALGEFACQHLSPPCHVSSSE
jgi:hypothetical protein